MFPLILLRAVIIIGIVLSVFGAAALLHWLNNV